MVSNPRGLFRQVADVIRTRIDTDDYPRGCLLPQAEQLGGELNVQPSVVRHALRVLAAEGLVQSTRGVGTEVTKLPPISREVPYRYSRAAREQADGRGAFDAEVSTLGMTPRSEVTVSRVVPSADVAGILGIPAGETNTVVRRRRMYADDVPVQLADSYIPLDIALAAGLDADDSGPGGMLSRLAEVGHGQVRMRERVTTRPPLPEEAEFLSLSEDHRVHAITHVGWDAGDRAVEVCLHVMPVHLWTLEYSWPAD